MAEIKDCDHECDEFYMHSECHPVEPTWLRIKDGIYDLICAECEKVVIPNMIIDFGDDHKNN